MEISMEILLSKTRPPRALILSWQKRGLLNLTPCQPRISYLTVNYLFSLFVVKTDTVS